MVRDKYGNYVVQKLIEVADDNMKENMVKRIITSQSLKKRDGFCKNIYSDIYFKIVFFFLINSIL